MRGIATIDRQTGSGHVTIWITSGAGRVEAVHTNAVEIDLDGDPEAVERVRSLTRCCAVLATDGTSLEGFPIEGRTLSVGDIDALIRETEARQAEIMAAVQDYRRTHKSNLIDPKFPASPERSEFQPTDDTSTARAFATANYLARAWTVWLKTDEERRRRTARPGSGESPWVMPLELNSPSVALLPEGVAAAFDEQALV